MQVLSHSDELRVRPQRKSLIFSLSANIVLKMDILRSGFQSVLGGGNIGVSDSAPTPADTIERLVDRLVSSTLLDDRRDACRALKAMSRKFRVLVGAQALDPLIIVLERDASDEEIVGYALDTISNICSPDEFEEELLAAKNGTSGLNGNSMSNGSSSVGEQFTEIYLKRDTNVQLIIDLLEEYDFKIRRPAIRLLTHLLTNQPRKMQETILASRMGVSRLMDVLVDSREVLRNDALLLLIQLTKGNANLQKIVAFENSFDKLVDIIEVEGYSDGGIVVEDCLRLMLNLLRNNSSNQTFFREGSYIQRISNFFDLNLDEEEIEIGWSAQKVSNMLHMLLVVRTLVSPSNPTQVTMSCQNTIQSCGLFTKFCDILMASGIPADILTETINTLSEIIRGNQKNQMVFSRVEAPSSPPRKALILLLMSMVNEKQPFSLRCAVLYCFQSYLFKNPTGQKEVLHTLLPSTQQQPREGVPPVDDITSGQLLCGGLFANDKLSNWFSAVAMAHGLMDQSELKTALLCVQLSTAAGKGPILLMEHCVTILQQSGYVQASIGLLMLLSTWVDDCPAAVTQLLTIPSVIPYLTGQIGSNEHDDLERLSQGLCAFLLGLCMVNNDSSVLGATQDKLMQLVEKRIGVENYLDKLSEIGKHEAYNKALKHPQLKCQDATELIFDNKFCQKFKHLEHVVVQHLTSNQSSEPQTVADAGILLQYKDLIREQDQRIHEITQANIYLQQELVSARQQAEEMASNVQALQDQNSLLRAHQQLQMSQQLHQQPIVVTNGPSAQGDNSEFEAKIRKMEQELRARDEVIGELELRLASLPDETVQVIPTEEESVEIQTLQKQLEGLRRVLAEKDDEIESLTSALKNSSSDETNGGDVVDYKEAFDALQAEQDDLLLMLSDQDAKLKDFAKRLAELGQPILEDD